MRLIIISFVILLSIKGVCQADNFKRHTIGSRFSGYFANSTDAHPIGASNTFELRLEPYYLFSLHKNFGIGVLGEYHTSNSTLQQVENTGDVYGFGLMGRYVYPSFIKNERFKDKLMFFAELSISTTNYYYSKDKSFNRSDNGDLEYTLLRIRPIGVRYDLYKGLGVDVSGMIYKFNPGRWGVLGNIGISFMF